MAITPAFIIDSWAFNGSKPKPLTEFETWHKNAWYHCQRHIEGLPEWLRQQGFNEGLINAALAEDTRPRFQKIDNESFLLILRGVNLNEGKAADDMLSLRVLFYRGSLLTFRKLPFKAINSVREELKSGIGPDSIAELLIAIIENIHLKIDDVLDQTEETLENLQDCADELSHNNQTRITNMHRHLLRLNRFLKPQTFALNELCSSQMNYFTDNELTMHLSNQRDAIHRIVENIESLIDQVWMLREHVQQALSETMNRNTYRLSVIAGVFLPLGFITGLLGVNVGGIPGTDSNLAFGLLCFALFILGVVEYYIFRSLRFL